MKRVTQDDLVEAFLGLLVNMGENPYHYYLHQEENKYKIVDLRTHTAPFVEKFLPLSLLYSHIMFAVNVVDRMTTEGSPIMEQTELYELVDVHTQEVRATEKITYSEAEARNTRLRDLNEPYRWVPAHDEDRQ